LYKSEVDFVISLVILNQKESSLENVVIHPRVMRRHPEICEHDAKDAFENMIASAPRIGQKTDQSIAIGSDSKGRLLELIYTRDSQGDVLIFHAFTPPTRKAMFELELTRRK
jgi:hypothetical protein